MGKLILHHLPGRPWLIQKFALLPPNVKGAITTLFAQEILGSANINAPVTTNLGINNTFRISIPYYAPGFILFGTPEEYRGERGPLDLSLVLSQKCSVFLDVGAHVGYYIYFLRGRGSNVPIHFFEPNEELYSLIKQNVNENHLDDIAGYNLALGDRCGRADFHLNISDPSSSSLDTYFIEKHRTIKTEINISTLDRFVETHNLKNIIVKVDVEAAEKQFLDGSAAALHVISYLIIEILGPAFQDGVVNRLIEAGFEAYYINDHKLEHTTDGTFNYIPFEYNWLFCREKPKQLQELVCQAGFEVISDSLS